MNGKTTRSNSAVLAIATKAARRLSLYATLASHRVLAVFGHRNYVPFIVLTRSRTGSNMLLSFLNSHPNVFCEGEIFAKLEGDDPIRRLHRTFGRQPRHIRAKGFKLFYYHPLDADAAGFWAELQSRTNIRIIHLTRDNILRTLVSRKIAGIKGAWTGTRFDPGEAHEKSVTVSVEELEEGFRSTSEWERTANERFGSHPVLHVTYEGLVRGPQECYEVLCRFLGVPAARPRTTLSQQNPEKLRDLVNNYDALKDHFAGSQWAIHFDE
jgi:LPS sulfotransferase NodH